MEARASLRGASVSKTFVFAVLVIVAMGLAAMGGYIAKSVQGSGTAVTQNPAVHGAPGTVLRQDKGTGGAPLDRGAEAGAPAAVLPRWAYRETTPNGNPPILVADRNVSNQDNQ